MGGGGKKPGEIYKVQVAATADQLILTGDKFDPSYFTTGETYVVIFTPYCGDYPGVEEGPTSDSQS